MLQLLPKDVVNYIYTILHQGNTDDIIHEYKQSLVLVTTLHNNLNQDNCYIIIILSPNVRLTFNYRQLNYIIPDDGIYLMSKDDTMIYKNCVPQAELPINYYA